jgi:hypothetical protein
MGKKRVGRRVVTLPVRLTFVSIREPMAFDDGGDPKYRITILAKKDSEAAKQLQKEMDELLKTATADVWNNKLPAKLWNPLRDGDEKSDEYEEFEDCIFMNAKSDYRPGCVLKDLSPIPIDQLDDEIYSGVYARACINLYPYVNAKGGCGVTVYLNSVQKIKDGDKIDRGGADPSKDFADDYSDLV